jgi:hypothetical protein
MSREEAIMRWSEMSANERNRLVAEKIMGYTVRKDGYYDGGFNHIAGSRRPAYYLIDAQGNWSKEELTPEGAWHNCPHYTTDMNDAWLIMDYLKPGRAGAEIEGIENHEKFLQLARFVDTLAYHMDSWWSWPRERLCAEICKAALRAVGVEIED